MKELRDRLNDLISGLEDAEEFRVRISSLTFVYPFNEYEYMISTLMGKDKLSLDEYHQLRQEFVDRNPHLHLFEKSAAGFGTAWVGDHVRALVPELEKPSTELDPKYSGHYDFYLDGIRVEVKASRAVAWKSDKPLYAKALSSESAEQFDMNFQQVKCGCCDVFIWVAVWSDAIRYWVLNSQELGSNCYFSVGQHRGNTGEGQLHLNRDNIETFRDYERGPGELLSAIREAYGRLPCSGT